MGLGVIPRHGRKDIPSNQISLFITMPYTLQIMESRFLVPIRILDIANVKLALAQVMVLFIF